MKFPYRKYTLIPVWLEKVVHVWAYALINQQSVPSNVIEISRRKFIKLGPIKYLPADGSWCDEIMLGKVSLVWGRVCQ